MPGREWSVKRKKQKSTSFKKSRVNCKKNCKRKKKPLSSWINPKRTLTKSYQNLHCFSASRPTVPIILDYYPRNISRLKLKAVRKSSSPKTLVQWSFPFHNHLRISSLLFNQNLNNPSPKIRLDANSPNLYQDKYFLKSIPLWCSSFWLFYLFYCGLHDFILFSLF